MTKNLISLFFVISTILLVVNADEPTIFLPPIYALPSLPARPPPPAPASTVLVSSKPQVKLIPSSPLPPSLPSSPAPPPPLPPVPVPALPLPAQPQPPRPPTVIIDHPPNPDRFLLKGIRNVRVIYDEEFQLRCLDAMNRKRLWHENTPPLVLGDNFTQYTIDRAWNILNDITDGKREITKGQYAFGESFFWYYDPLRYRTVEEAINTWYEESRHYDYSKPEFSARTGGFTQLIWRGSREATCVKIEYETPKSFKTLVVANFWPAGNVKGEFPMNVLPIRQTRPDLIEPGRPINRPWPRPPYRPPQPDVETYPTHPLLHHVADFADKPVPNIVIDHRPRVEQVIL